MLTYPGNARIFIFRETTDLRKGFEGLCALVERAFGSDELISGAFFSFLNRRRDRIKILYWDSDGFAIWYKRLERGSFPKRKLEEALVDRRTFLMMLEGVVPKRLQKRFKIV